MYSRFRRGNQRFNKEILFFAVVLIHASEFILGHCSKFCCLLPSTRHFKQSTTIWWIILEIQRLSIISLSRNLELIRSWSQICNQSSNPVRSFIRHCSIANLSMMEEGNDDGEYDDDMTSVHSQPTTSVWSIQLSNQQDDRHIKRQTSSTWEDGN